MVAGYHAARAVLSELRGLARRRAPALIGEALGSAGDRYGRTHRDGDLRWRHNGLWTSHEALLLDYEEALVSETEARRWYLASTHFPGSASAPVRPTARTWRSWLASPTRSVGDRSRCHSRRRRRTVRATRPASGTGQADAIPRLGADRVRTLLPPLAYAVREAGHPVVWMCDPMHGNTRIIAAGVKTRHLDDITGEAAAFHETLDDLDQWPGGLDLEPGGRM